MILDITKLIKAKFISEQLISSNETDRFVGEINEVYFESLILAQDERWRRA